MRRGLFAIVGALLITAVMASPAGGSNSATPSDRVAAVDRYLVEQIAAQHIPGLAVAITQGQQVVHVAGFGHDSAGNPVTESTLFQVASLSKSFTALAVLQLVDEGLLRLDDTVVSHLPEFQLADPRGSLITVRQLLTQTSGLADSTNPDFSKSQPSSLAEAIESMRDSHLAADPGTRWSYHNPNYQIAARLVEVVSGEPFGDYIRRHIFEPAGMSSSVTETTNTDAIPGLADGHIVVFGMPVPAAALGTFVEGSGGVVSTAADMAQWLIVNANDGRAANGAELVSPEGFRQWHTPGSPSGYALGWFTAGPADAPTQLDHTGNQMTYGAAQVLIPGQDLGVALLFNSSSIFQSDQTAIRRGVLAILRGEPAPSTTSGLPSWAVDALLGAISIAALILGALAVIRSARWARHHRGKRVRLVLGLLPSLALVALVALVPLLASLLYDGRNVTWIGVFYGWPALAIAGGVAGSAAVLTLAARVWNVVRSGSWTRSPANPAASSAGTERADVSVS